MNKYIFLPWYRRIYHNINITKSDKKLKQFSILLYLFHFNIQCLDINTLLSSTLFVKSVIAAFAGALEHYPKHTTLLQKQITTVSPFLKLFAAFVSFFICKV